MADFLGDAQLSRARRSGSGKRIVLASPGHELALEIERLMPFRKRRGRASDHPIEGLLQRRLHLIALIAKPLIVEPSVAIVRKFQKFDISLVQRYLKLTGSFEGQILDPPRGKSCCHPERASARQIFL